MAERHKLIAAVYLFLAQDGKVLLSRRYNTGYHDGEYSLVAGHIEKGESATAAMVREAEEEAGIAIKPESLKLAHFIHRKGEDGDERMNFFFTTDRWDGEPHIVEPEKCDELRWFPIADLPENVIPYIRTAIENWHKGVLYSEYGW